MKFMIGYGTVGSTVCTTRSIAMWLKKSGLWTMAARSSPALAMGRFYRDSLSMGECLVEAHAIGMEGLWSPSLH